MLWLAWIMETAYLALLKHSDWPTYLKLFVNIWYLIYLLQKKHFKSFKWNNIKLQPAAVCIYNSLMNMLTLITKTKTKYKVQKQSLHRCKHKATTSRHYGSC